MLVFLAGYGVFALGFSIKLADLYKLLCLVKDTTCNSNMIYYVLELTLNKCALKANTWSLLCRIGQNLLLVVKFAAVI